MHEDDAGVTVFSTETPGSDTENDDCNINNEDTGSVRARGQKRDRFQPTAAAKPKGNPVHAPKSEKSSAPRRPRANEEQLEGAVNKNRRTRRKQGVHPKCKAEDPAESEVVIDFVRKIQDL